MKRMTRTVLLFATLVACDKPAKEDCRKALVNMQHLMGTENQLDQESLDGEIRRCQGGSRKSAVDCAMKANTMDELRACDFFKVPDKVPGSGAGSGSAPGSGSGSAR
jgi:hypothetical protein